VIARLGWRSGRMMWPATLLLSQCIVGVLHAQSAPGYTRNDYGEVGLMQTPTARMADEGELAFTASRTYPYTDYNLSLQPLPWIEGTFRYSSVSNRLYGPTGLSGHQSYKDKSIDLKLRRIAWRYRDPDRQFPYNSSPVLPSGSMWTRNRLRRPSEPEGLSNCLEMPVRQRFNSARCCSRVTMASELVAAVSLAPNRPAMPTPSTSAMVASTRSEGEERPRSIWLRKPIDKSVRAAIASSDSLRLRLMSRMRCPTATSTAGSAFTAFLLMRLPPLTSDRVLHVYENLACAIPGNVSIISLS